MDEADTFANLARHRRELVNTQADQYGGRTIVLLDDGALMEFASVVDAVVFAVKIHCAMRERNAGVSESRQVNIRIGIKIGDIIVEDGDIFGDGVTIAAYVVGYILDVDMDPKIQAYWNRLMRPLSPSVGAT